MVTAIIQARVGSTRFPGKVFADLAGRPLIWHVVDRIRKCRNVQGIVLATTLNSLDDPLAIWAKGQGVSLFRGDEEDVLARFHGAARAYGVDIVVRVTADDPFKDPQIIDKVVQLLIDNNLDFASNNNPPSFPEGLDVEAFTIDALDRANHMAISPFDREHVTQCFYKNIDIFLQKNLSNNVDLSFLRWTIDTPLDYQLAQAVYGHLYVDGKIFYMDDILELLKIHVKLSTLNSTVPRSTMYQGKKGIK